jgi:hypothetical protein
MRPPLYTRSTPRMRTKKKPADRADFVGNVVNNYDLITPMGTLQHAI